MNIEPSVESYDIVEPDAGALIESLRGFGYSTRTAIADLIDNSITASARNVWLYFCWDGQNSFISIRDDGNGMAETELINAMRPGSKNPLDTREPSDLGRFGLGLKTASFSQCRKLTVHTCKADHQPATRCWDLDEVTKSGQWRLLKSVTPSTEKYSPVLGKFSTGTLVVWENLDRIVGDATLDDIKAKNRFLQTAKEVDFHLGMVFHRYLSRSIKLNIFVYGNQEYSKIEPWDPFLIENKATQHLGDETLPYKGQKIYIKAYVLPHHTKLLKTDHSTAGGSAGWNAMQGFYVYRNERLLVAGDWLDLPFTKEEHYKLARIQVDLPNTMDQDWHIDVRKSKAQPPGPLKEDFKRIAKMTRERAVSVYRHKGKIIAHSKSEGFIFPWKRELKLSKVYYRVNQEHPLIQEILKVNEPFRGLIRSFIRLIEETVPVPLIAIDHAEHPEEQTLPFETAPSKEIMQIIQDIYSALQSSGLSKKAARERLINMDPFHNYPELIASLDDQPQSDDKE
jgi:hypothetical protein